MVCEICKRDTRLRIVASSRHNLAYVMCDECFLSFVCQFYKWDDVDIENYVSWDTFTFFRGGT